MTHQWYAAIDNQPHGPMSSSQLAAQFEERKINGRTLLWHEGMADWVSAEECLKAEESAELRVAQLYSALRWYRKSTVCSALLLIGLFVFRPLIFIPVVSCLTGPIYYRKLNQNGELATWSWANKVAAVIILLLGIAFMVFMITMLARLAPEG